MTLSKTCTLSDSLTISKVLGGLWQVADMERDGKTLDPQQASQAMAGYVKRGITTFDMADHYGSAELIAGAYQNMQHVPPAQFLTKWVPTPGAKNKDEVRAAVERSLQRLATDSIDLLQFHAWNYCDPSWLDTMFYLQELKEEGLIKNIGVTNFDTTHLRIALSSGVQIVTNQVSYSILDQRAATGMTSLCQEFGVKILAFGTLGGGLISEKWLGKPEPKSLDSWSQMKYKRFIDASGGWHKFQRVLEVLQQVAVAHKRSLSNIATNFVLQAPVVAGIIIGARLGERDHIDDNLGLFDFQLAEHELASIKEARAQLNPIPGDCGDEYRQPPFLTAAGDLSDHLSDLPKPYQVITGKHKKKVLSGTTWEDLAGFSRAVMKGKRICISGTTATQGTRVIGDQDPEAQTHFVLDKIEGALHSFGASLEQVIRTRIFIKNMKDWEVIAKVHGARFATIQPANTMVQAGLIGDEYLVEIEAEAEID